MMIREAVHPDRYEIIDIGDRFDPKLLGVAVKKDVNRCSTSFNPAIESLKTSGKIDRLMQQIQRSAMPSLKRKPRIQRAPYENLCFR